MIDWDKFDGGVLAVAIPGTKEYAQRHGVYRLGDQVRSILTCRLQWASLQLPKIY